MNTSTKARIGLAAALALLAPLSTLAQDAEAPTRAPLVPEASLSLPPGEGGYILEEIGDWLWWAGNGFYQVLIMEGPEGVAVMDAPPSMRGLTLPAVAEATGGWEITHLVYSHGHGDHIGAAGALAPEGSGAEIVAHEATATQIARGAPCLDCADLETPRPMPTTTFGEAYTLDLGDGQVLELSYPGPNHQDGNIFIHAPNHDALMIVDVIYPGWVPFDLLAISSDIPGWLEAYDEALDFELDTFVGGHLGRAGTRSDVEEVRAYIRDVEASARAALEGLDRGAFVGEIGAEAGFENPWFLFDAYSRRMAEDCAEPVIAEWTGRLGGVETFTEAACLRMQYALRID